MGILMNDYNYPSNIINAHFTCYFIKLNSVVLSVPSTLPWFWQGINSVLRNYFSQDITEVNYLSKSARQGIFNEKLELLKEQKQKSRSVSKSELNKPPELLKECLQGDILKLFQEFPQNWLQECYSTESQLSTPSLAIKGHAVADISSTVRKEENKIQKRSLYNLGKSLWKHAGILITLLLATQMAFAQAAIERSNQLVKLKNTLQNTRSNNGREPREVICGCDDTYDEYELSVLFDSNIYRGFIQLGEYEDSSDCEFYNACTDSHAKFQKQINEIKQKYSPKVNASHPNLQLLLTISPNNAKLELMPVKKENCISEIGKGHIETAVDIYKKTTDAINAQVLKDVIEKAYCNCDQPNNFDNILNFIAQLRSLSDKVISYEALYEKMEKNDPKILIFDAQIRKDIQNQQIYKNNSELVQMLNDLKNKLIIPVNNILDKWGHKIRHNKDQEIIEFAKEYKYCFHDNVDQLIEKAYAKKLDNADPILKFIQHLPNSTSVIVALSSLFGKMKDNNHLDSSQLLKLANNVKKYMEMPYYSIISKQYRDKFAELKDSFPSSVRRLIWNGGNCIIRNRRDDKELYAGADDLAYDKQRRRVFIWTPGRCTSQCYWDITSKTYSENFSLKFKTFDEYLYPELAPAKLNYFKYVAYTWREKNKVISYWKLKPINNASFFTIKDTSHNLYLCGAYNLPRRKPDLFNRYRRFIMAQSNYQATVCDWKILC